MFCCGGSDNEPKGLSEDQYTAPSKGGSQNGGTDNFCFFLFNVALFVLQILKVQWLTGGAGRGEPRAPSGVKPGGAPQEVLPIEVPYVPLDELNKMTDNFGKNALIGEGSYGRVFYGTFNDQPAAIKKLDTGSSPEPDSEFGAQVRALGNNITVVIKLMICT